jgi:epoxyqueuosine reductase
MAPGKNMVGDARAVKARSADKVRIADKARGLGFAAVGIARAEGAGERQSLERFLAEGRAGDMAWMRDRRDVRGKPEAIWTDARSVVVVGFSYAPSGEPLAALADPETAAIALYARRCDYHDVIKKRLDALARWMVEEFGGETRVFVDTAPVMEKPLAQRAGIGWQGKHTNLVSREFGSWLLLGEVFTTLELPPDAPAEDICGSCDACVRACPTGALDAPYRIDARKCISYLTIEHKGEIAPELARLMGNRVFGCDNCLAACPWNKFAPPANDPATDPALAERAEFARFRLADLARLDDAGFRKTFAGTPIKRTGHTRMMRNIGIARENSGRR